MNTSSVKPLAMSLALSAMVLLAPFAEARSIATKDFKKGNLVLQSIAILPPQAEMKTAKVGADDEMIAESRNLEKFALEQAIANFEAKGYALRVVTAEDIEADPELQDLLRQVNSRFDEESQKIAARPGQLKKGRYTIGEEVQVLADYLGVDGIVFERVYMEVAAAGQMAMAFLVGGSAGGSAVQFTVVNGEDGKVIGFFDAILGVIGEKKAREKAQKMVTDMSAKALKWFPQGPGDAVVADDSSEEDVLSELEGLLDDGDSDAPSEPEDEMVDTSVDETGESTD